MRGVLILAGVLSGLGVVMAQVADRMATSPPALARAATETSFDAPQTTPRTVAILRDRAGHFRAEGRVNGRHLAFMIDTGASVVALNESAAADLGIRPTPADYKVDVATANGKVRAARAQLDRVAVGDLVVRDVDALVLPDAALSENLLGLSYLSRLTRFEYAGGRMVLEQ
ncbi:MAG: TIGR02281 family clan AA aspartic protease [Proteobacteria bacterium]|nr:MAG: TIGR02281 family clan AA aspartic protease [Pseudomonadota bacterium]